MSCFKQTFTALTLFLLPMLSIAQNCQTTTISATTPSSQFKDNGNGTVTDSKTGLMWKKCSEGQTGNNCDGSEQGYNWQGALQQAQSVNNGGGFAGYKDWRVPNIKELITIVEEQCIAPAINLTIFPNTPSSYFWSSSPSAHYRNYAWEVNFFDGGYNGTLDKLYKYARVRLVRGGQ